MMPWRSIVRTLFRELNDFVAPISARDSSSLERHLELDVVAVYTASDINTKQVTTLHTDRVSPSCPINTVTVPSQTVLFVPPDIGGEDAYPEFNGNGPCVKFDLSLETEDGDKTLTANYRMHAYECSNDFEQPKHDFTAAAGKDQLVLAVASPRGRILGHNLGTMMQYEYIDEDHQDDVETFLAPNPVEKLRFTGDTAGEEAGTKNRSVHYPTGNER